MEVPIPNFYFMGVQFIHLLALSVWVGGIVIIGAIVAPTLFRDVKSRRTAGLLMGEILRKFDKISLFCAAALITTGLIKYWSWENLTPWNFTRYVAILVMSAAGAYSAWGVTPRLREWLDPSSAAPPRGRLEPLPAEGIVETERGEFDFNRLHHLSVRLMMINLVCGIIALLMA